MIRDQWLLSPKRIVQAMLVYFWWMNLAEHQPMKLAPMGCHMFYYRREDARERHGAGYFAPLGTVLRAHLREAFRVRPSLSRNRPSGRSVRQGSMRQS